MARRSYACRKDGNHNEIADIFLGMGCSVLDLSRVGDDCPDMLVGISAFNVLVEVKNTEARGKLTEGQKRFIRDWNGPAEVCSSVDEAVAIVQKYRARMRQ